jgi:hypothetical protein
MSEQEMHYAIEWNGKNNNGKPFQCYVPFSTFHDWPDIRTGWASYPTINKLLLNTCFSNKIVLLTINVSLDISLWISKTWSNYCTQSNTYFHFFLLPFLHIHSNFKRYFLPSFPISHFFVFIFIPISWNFIFVYRIVVCVCVWNIFLYLACKYTCILKSFVADYNYLRHRLVLSKSSATIRSYYS